MRWKTQWGALLLLLLLLLALGAYQCDQEQKPAADAVYTTLVERVETPKLQWTPTGKTTVRVNACQSFGFVSLSFLLLLAAHNLVLLRTPMLLTRYPTWRAYRRTVFLRLLAFSLCFLLLAALALQLLEKTALQTGLARYLFINPYWYPKAFAVYLLHLLLCTALVCLYQTKAIFARHYILTQAIPMLFLVASLVTHGTWLQQISPFSFPCYDGLPEGGLVQVILTYVVCFAALLVVCRRPKREYLAEEVDA